MLLNKDLHFHAVDHSLSLTLDSFGGVSGWFLPVTNYVSKREYACKGCYDIPEANVINLAFTIDWIPPTKSQSNFTCFSGQIINENVLILDWVLIDQREENNYAVYGSSFLYSQLQMNRKDKIVESVKPYPITVAVAHSGAH